MALYAAEEGAQTVAPAVANPAPLGLSAFALTTFVLSCSNAGFLFPSVASGATVVVGLAFFYGGLMQLVAGIQEFRAGNTFGATAFCSYGGFWMALGFVLLPVTGILASLVSAKAVSQGVGVFLLGWTIFTALMFIATLRLNGALVLVFGLLTLTFLALTIGWLGGLGTGTFTTWVQIGGWLGIVTALAAWYTALAGVLASVKLVNLPTIPMDRS
jgi:succinate-acetate transporter protein